LAPTKKIFLPSAPAHKNFWLRPCMHVVLNSLEGTIGVFLLTSLNPFDP